ncbi:hypothetical protein C8Q76DRAFT_802428 [Earliella scabrosa]|nr:hypothetical protein C8Q76DRAFT_802428 [Earliella scabrosa]
MSKPGILFVFTEPGPAVSTTTGTTTSTFLRVDRRLDVPVPSRAVEAYDVHNPGPYLLAVLMEVLENKEEDGNGWYNEEHIALLAEVPYRARFMILPAQLVCPRLGSNSRLSYATCALPGWLSFHPDTRGPSLARHAPELHVATLAARSRLLHIVPDRRRPPLRGLSAELAQGMWMDTLPSRIAPSSSLLEPSKTPHCPSGDVSCPCVRSSLSTAPSAS